MILGIVASCGYPIQNGVNTFAPILGTTYFKFYETLATARGPIGLGDPLSDFDYSVWVAFQDGTDIVVERFDGTTWTDRTVIATDIVGIINHISLTFDASGNFVCAFEISGNVFLRYYDTLAAANLVKPLGAGKSPFCSMEVFNSFLGSRQVHLVYVKPNKDLICLLQDERYLIEYVVLSNVDDILSFGITGYNNLKITYTDSALGGQRILNVATPRKGMWVGEMPKNTFTLPEMLVEIKSADVYLNETDSVAFGQTVSNVSIQVASAYVRIDEPSPVDNSFDTVAFGQTVSNVVVTLSNIINKTTQTEAVPPVLENTATSVTVSVPETGITTMQTELTLPPVLENTATSLLITVTPP